LYDKEAGFAATNQCVCMYILSLTTFQRFFDSSAIVYNLNLTMKHIETRG